MGISIEETAFVRTLQSPFDHNHVLSLSDLDTDCNLLITLRYLRVYSGSPSGQADPFHVVTSALSTALGRYYPFAGTLRRRYSDGRLELHCNAGDGVPVNHAAVNSPLSQVNYLQSDVNDNFTEQLVRIRTRIRSDPYHYRSRNSAAAGSSSEQPCTTRSATSSEPPCSSTPWLNWHTGRVIQRTTPVWDRTDLLGPRSPPRVEFPIGKFLGLDEGFSPYQDSGKRIIREWLDLKEESLDQLKGLLTNQSRLNFTTFEALCAFIWRAEIRACGVSGDDNVTFAYSINIKKAVKPPLPSGYWGNGCVPMYVRITAKEVADQPIWKTADYIKKSKQNATGEYVSSFIDFQELHYQKGILGGRRVSGFTDWQHLGHSTVDFGWGCPLAVVLVSRRLLGSVEPCFLLPWKEGIKVLVT